MLAALATVPAAAQLPDTSGVIAERARDEDLPPWRTSWFPRLTAGSNDGPVLAVRLRHFQQALYDDRVRHTGELTAEAGASLHGSRYLALGWHAPRLARGWRAGAQLAATRENRYGWFGLGAEAAPGFPPAAPPPAGADVTFANRVRRTRYVARAEVTRRVAAPWLRVAVSAEAVAARWSALPGAARFAAEQGAALAQDDLAARAAIVVDTRDTEFNPASGVLLEAGAQRGTGGSGYTRVYGIARGWLRLGEGMTLAARAAGSRLTGGPTLDARFTLPGWDRPLEVLGNEGSHRALAAGRFGGTGLVLANAELRWEPLFLGDLGGLVVAPFLDAGRTFEGSWSLTTDRLVVGGGVAVGARLLRDAVTLVNVATGPDGARVTVSYGWMF